MAIKQVDLNYLHMLPIIILLCYFMLCLGRHLEEKKKLSSYCFHSASDVNISEKKSFSGLHKLGMKELCCELPPDTFCSGFPLALSPQGSVSLTAMGSMS